VESEWISEVRSVGTFKPRQIQTEQEERSWRGFGELREAESDRLGGTDRELTDRLIGDVEQR